MKTLFVILLICFFVGMYALGDFLSERSENQKIEVVVEFSKMSEVAPGAIVYVTGYYSTQDSTSYMRFENSEKTVGDTLNISANSSYQY